MSSGSKFLACKGPSLCYVSIYLTSSNPPIYAVHTSQNFFNKWAKISSLEITIFDLKMMVKSGLEFFILKFTEPLQRYLLTCLANSAFLGRFCALGSSNSEEASRSSKKKSRPLFTIIFSSKMLVSRPEILVHLFQPFKVEWDTALQCLKKNQNYQPAQNQPKSQFLFHKNCSPRDLYIMTLPKEQIKEIFY